MSLARSLALLAALATAAVPARAQLGDADPADLTDVVLVGVGVGSARQRLDGSTADRGPAVTRLLGTARLTAWVRPTWAVDLSAARFGPTDDGAVTPVLLGAAWYPRPAAAAPRVRPYLGASVGLFVRSLRDANDGIVGAPLTPARTDAVPGARLGAGVDALVGRRLAVGLLAGYHLAGHFPDSESRLGGVANRPTGAMFAVNVGLLLRRPGGD